MRLLSIVLSAAMGGGPPAFAEMAQPVGDPTAAEAAAESEPTLTIAGLDSDDLQLGDALTNALRDSAERRGLSLVGNLALSELRLAGGCADNAEACLAKGTKLIGGDRLIFGKLAVQAGGEATVRIAILDVESAAVHTQTSVPLAAEALQADAIASTADRLLNELVPPPVDDVAPAVPAIDDVRPSPALPADEPATRSQYVWGNYSPRPRWKRAWVGASVGVTAVAIGGVITTGLLTRRLEVEIVADAQSSSGSSAISESNLQAGISAICLQATEALPTGIYNGPIGTKCRNAERTVLATNVFIGFAVVGGLSTVASIVMLFVRRDGGKSAVLAPEISPRSAGLSLRGKF